MVRLRTRAVTWSISVIAGLVAISMISPTSAQSAPLSITADKGGYVVGDMAKISVTGLNECGGQQVRLGMRSVAAGNVVVAAPLVLDATGAGSVQLALPNDNGSIPMQAAAWGDCVNRGLEPGLALDPHPMLISVSRPAVSPPATGSGPGVAEGRTPTLGVLVAGLALLGISFGGLGLAKRRRARVD